jgi:hypothetical protein
VALREPIVAGEVGRRRIETRAASTANAFLDIPIRVTLESRSRSVARTADFDAKDRS